MHSEKRSGRKRSRLRGLQLMLESLEERLVLSSVTTYHNDIASSGQNLSEVLLTRANVNPTTFGKLYSYAVDGQVYAQPLVQTQVNITTGPQTGLHDVMFVMIDCIYMLTVVMTTSVCNADDGRGRVRPTHRRAADARQGMCQTSHSCYSCFASLTLMHTTLVQ